MIRPHAPALEGSSRPVSGTAVRVRGCRTCGISLGVQPQHSWHPSSWHSPCKLAQPSKKPCRANAGAGTSASFNSANSSQPESTGQSGNLPQVSTSASSRSKTCLLLSQRSSSRQTSCFMGLSHSANPCQPVPPVSRATSTPQQSAILKECSVCESTPKRVCKLDPPVVRQKHEQPHWPWPSLVYASPPCPQDIK